MHARYTGCCHANPNQVFTYFVKFTAVNMSPLLFVLFGFQAVYVFFTHSLVRTVSSDAPSLCVLQCLWDRGPENRGDGEDAEGSTAGESQAD